VGVVLPSLPPVVTGAAPGAVMDTLRPFLSALAAAIYTCDAQGRVTLFNEAAAELWGRRPTLGTDLWCGSWKIFKPDGSPLPLDSCPMAVALKEGRGVRGVEIIVERPDGTRRHVLPHPEPMRDAAGNVVGAVNLLLDITDQREAERAQALLAAIVGSSDDAIISKSLDGRITSWNGGAQRIFGYLAEEIIGRPVTTLIPHDRLLEEQMILDRLRRGERIDHFHTVRRTKDGRLIDVSLTVSPVRDATGRLIGASKVARDISVEVAARDALQRHQAALEEAVAKRTAELEESHQRLRLSERMASLGTLSAGLGHDMGNLLVPVRVSLEALEEAKLPADARGDVERIRASARYLQQLANGLRMMALDPEGSGPAEPLHVKTWWNDAYPIARNALPRGVTLEAEVAEDAWVKISRPALTQAIFNLAQNAGEVLRARPDGRVRVGVERKGGYVFFSVEDNGPGMTDEVVKRCMEPFFTTKPRAISTGLGLVLVGGIVREAGGSLQIRTELGRGTTFHFALPLAVPRIAAPSGTPRGYALIDIQDPRLRALVASELGHLTFEVLADARDRDIDIAVTDGRSPLSPETLAARQVVLFGEANGYSSKVNAIGPSPKLQTIRSTLRMAAHASRPTETTAG
jgi:PAS domain S-box-containing protein